MSINQKGFSLVEVMIGAALLGGVALVTAKLMEDQAANQAYILAEAEMSQTVSMAESYLNNPVSCKQMLGGKTSSVAGTPIGTTNATALEPNLLMITVPRPPDPDQVKSVLGEGNLGKVTIPDNGLVLKTSEVGNSVSDLNITFVINSKAMKQKRTIVVKKIPIVVQLDAGGVVRACGPVLSDSNDVAREKMCRSLPGVAQWDPTLKTCKVLSVKCGHGYVASRMTSLGGIICVKLEDQLKISDFFDTATVNCSGKLNIQVIEDPVTKKLKMNCY